MMDIMPSRALVAHEWEKHGTCTGLATEAYFQQARHAYEEIAVPARYRSPDDALRVTAADVRAAFRAANPSLPADALAVLCNGKFLTEVRICLSKDLAPRACGKRMGDTCEGDAIMRPVRPAAAREQH